MHPVTPQQTRHPGKGYLKENELHDIELTVTETELIVGVNGEERAKAPTPQESNQLDSCSEFC